MADPRRLSTSATRVQRSGIREVLALAVTRPGLVRMEIGEPDFPTPAHVRAAAAEAAERGSGYVQSAGTPRLVEAVRRRLAERAGLEVEPSRVVVSQGAGQGLAAVFAALVSPGDQVLVPDPAWPNYEMQVTLLGGVPVRYRVEPGADEHDVVATLERAIGERTRAVVVNSPSNPTGDCWSPEVVAAVVDLARSRGVLVISDEVYDEVLFEGGAARAVSHGPDDVVGVYSLSKTYAMTGWRVGYLALPRWLAPTVAQMQEPLLSCVSSVTQAAAVAALEGPQDVVAEMVAAYRTRRDAVLAQLTAALGPAPGGRPLLTPAGAFYVVLPLADGVDSRLAALDLVEHGVGVAPGSAFGDVLRSSVRLSLASSVDDLRVGVSRLTDWYAATGGGQRRLEAVALG